MREIMGLMNKDFKTALINTVNMLKLKKKHNINSHGQLAQLARALSWYGKVAVSIPG